MDTKQKKDDFIILTETIEKGCIAFQLLYIPKDKSKYINEITAFQLREKYGIQFYDMYRWIKKQQEHNSVVLKNL